MTSLRLYKREKLCSHTAINLLFTKGEGRVTTAYPLRAVWRINEQRQVKDTQFLISVPKKKFKHAVDRVLLRRRIRESYRLNRSALEKENTTALDIAFIYLGSNICHYSEIEHAIIKLLGKISVALKDNPAINETCD